MEHLAPSHVTVTVVVYLLGEFRHQDEVPVEAGGGGPGVGRSEQRHRELLRETQRILVLAEALRPGESQQVRGADHVRAARVSPRRSEAVTEALRSSPRAGAAEGFRSYRRK